MLLVSVNSSLTFSAGLLRGKGSVLWWLRFMGEINEDSLLFAIKWLHSV